MKSEPGLLVLILAGILFLTACDSTDVGKLSDTDMQRIANTTIICESPYMRFETGCCLDKNNNSICDKDEIQEDNDTIKRYIEKTCLSSCDDKDICTIDTCSELTGYECNHETITLCCGNGICEAKESFNSCNIDCEAKYNISINIDNFYTYGDNNEQYFRGILLNLTNHGNDVLKNSTIQIIIERQNPYTKEFIKLDEYNINISNTIFFGDEVRIQEYVDGNKLERHNSVNQDTEFKIITILYNNNNQVANDTHIFSIEANEHNILGGIEYSDYIFKQTNPYPDIILEFVSESQLNIKTPYPNILYPNIRIINNPVIDLFNNHGYMGFYDLELETIDLREGKTFNIALPKAFICKKTTYAQLREGNNPKVITSKEGCIKDEYNTDISNYEVSGEIVTNTVNVQCKTDADCFLTKNGVLRPIKLEECIANKCVSRGCAVWDEEVAQMKEKGLTPEYIIIINSKSCFD